jgi:hypothetical protein
VGLLLYAITTPPAAEASRRILTVNELTAWISPERVPDAGPFTRTDLLEHHRVVTEIFEQVEGCLPARFPTVLVDAAAVQRHLEERQGELTRQIEAVRGACELAVTAVWTTDDAAPVVQATTPGREYMLRRQAELTASDERHARAEAVAAEIEHATGDALRDSERHVCPSHDVALSIALLVARPYADAVRERLGHVSRRDVRILVHGPWPPYTFAGVRSTSGRKS